MTFIFIFFFFRFFPSLLDVGMQSGERGERDRSTQQNRPTSACITAYKNGSRGGVGGSGGQGSETKTKQRRYVQPPLWNRRRRPSDGPRCLPVPHNFQLLFFFVGFFSIYFFKHTNNFALYYPAKLKKYTVAAWHFFSTTKKRYGKYLQREQATVKNTSLNINTIVPTLSEH